jgi:hypothetical protein
MVICPRIDQVFVELLDREHSTYAPAYRSFGCDKRRAELPMHRSARSSLKVKRSSVRAPADRTVSPNNYQKEQKWNIKRSLFLVVRCWK